MTARVEHPPDMETERDEAFDERDAAWARLAQTVAERDLALARVRELDEALAKAVQERATLDRVRDLARWASARAHRSEPAGPGRCGCLACRMTEALR